MRHAFPVVGLLLAWLLAGLGLAGCTRCAGSASLPGYLAGQSRSYDFNMIQQSQGANPREDFQRLIIGARMTLTVEKADPARGDATLLLRFARSGGQRMDAQGSKVLPELAQLDKASFRVELGEHGAKVTVTPVEPFPEQMRPLIRNFKQSLRELFPSVPPTLAEGTNWSRQMEEPLPETASKLVTQSRYDLRGEASMDPRTPMASLVNVQHKLRIETLPSAAGKPAMRATGQGEGKGQLYLDTKDGTLAGASFDTNLRLNLVPPQGGRDAMISQVFRSHIELRPLGAEEGKP